MASRLRPLALAGLVLLTACGAANHTAPSASAILSPPDAKTHVLSSVRALSATSFHATFTLNMTLAATGPQASRLGALGTGGQAVVDTMHLTVESQSRARIDQTLVLAGRTVAVTSVVYDGVLYLSTDGGTSFKRVSLAGSLPSQYTAGSVLQYLEAVATVTDQGPGTDGGVAVERYHASLDPAKTIDLIKSATASLGNSQVTALFAALQLSDATVDLDLDHAGNPTVEKVALAASLDLSAIDPTWAGTTLSLKESGSGTFSDFHAAITVAPPTNIVGSMAL